MSKLLIIGACLLIAGCTKQSRPQSKPAAPKPAQAQAALPRLLDLGADKCMACKKLAPIIEELKKTHAEYFKTEFIDVWKNPDAAKQYEVKTIPTQIFFDKDGKELFRHIGFFSKEEILNKWKELGVSCTK